ncbi:uncharacterized protein LOC142320323 isoform X2 [Lycorma delicatula]
MLQFDSRTSAEFGWLLKDLPEHGDFGIATRSYLDITQTFIKKNSSLKNTSKLFQFQCSKTPSPKRSHQYASKNKIILANTWPSPRLSHTIELDDPDELQLPRYQFFRAATLLDHRIEDISFQVVGMQNHTKTLKQAYEELDDVANQLLEEVRCLITEIQNVRFLEDLLCLLDGKTDNISLQKWPFIMAHSSPFDELNLIV